MCEHDQSQVAVKTVPEAPLVIVESQFALGVLIEAFDHPAHMNHPHQRFQRRLVESPNEILLLVAGMAFQGAFPDEPAAAGDMLAPLAAAVTCTRAHCLARAPLVPFRQAMRLHASGGSPSRITFTSWHGMRSSSVEALRGRPFPTYSGGGGSPVSASTASAGRKRTAADRRPVSHLAGFQTVQEGGLIPIARIEHRCLGANAGLAGLVDQVQGDLARELGRLLHRLINEEQVPPGDIAILLGRRPESIGLPRQGSICAFPITNAQEPDPGRVTLETIHRFKGMEAPVVILTGLEGMFARTAETLLYVGMTGAKELPCWSVSTELRKKNSLMGRNAKPLPPPPSKR